jgi:cyclopropane fatty-acyl-phospholipid synthase-like methyltransferase
LIHDRDSFRSSYAGSPPWDIGKPQPAFEAAADKVVGSVLDAGCGTGEHALFFAARGHNASGFDFLDEPITAARRKAAERGLMVKFLVKDAVELREWSERFDTVVDSGLFHVFSDADRIRYVRGLETVLNPGGRLLLLCFSDATPGTEGPRRVSQSELRQTFADGWEIESLEPVRLEIRPEYKQGTFSDEEPRGWLFIARRLA